MSKSKRIRINAEKETPPQIVRGELYSYRYAYARAADTRADEDMGQDYLTFEEDENIFSFALCDGVSQSFFGDLAARYLGNALLNWLKKVSSTTGSYHLQESLELYLNELSGLIHKKVQVHPLPDDTPRLIRSVLEEKRELGSETTFVCGRIILPSESAPLGQAIFAWMGDSRLRLWDQKNEHTNKLGDTFHTHQRWSTKKGVVGGQPHTFSTSIEGTPNRRSLDRLMAYSDGLSMLDNVAHIPSNHMLENMMARADSSPNSDDISYLEIWIGEAPSNISHKPQKRVLNVGLRKTSPQQIALNWEPQTEADYYYIRMRNQEDRIFKSMGSTWTTDPLSPGKYTFQIQAVHTNGEPGLWSLPVSGEILSPEAQEIIPSPEKAQKKKFHQPLVTSKPSSLQTRTGLIGFLIAVSLLSLFGIYVYFGDVANPPPTQTAIKKNYTQPGLIKVTKTPSAIHSPTQKDTPRPAVTSTPTVPVTNTPASPKRTVYPQETEILPLHPYSSGSFIEFK